MMKKETKKYYFSVEGETEQWYLQWLQKTVNESKTAYSVKFDSKIQKNPLKRAKQISVLEKTEIIHLFDRESENAVHTKEFKQTLDKMKAAEKIGKNIKYHSGYSNFSFELWIILHKIDFYKTLSCRKQYLPVINKIFQEQFQNLKEYKEEQNFKKILNQLTLKNVSKAIDRAKTITNNNKKNGYKPEQYKGYKFYKENPSLSLWEFIEKILIEIECDVLFRK